MTVGAVVPAAGRGTRFGSAGNKVWALLDDLPLIAWSTDALCAHQGIDEVVVVGQSGELARLRSALPHPKVRSVVAGGSTRAASVLAGVEALSAAVDTVLVHDGARPWLSAGLIDRVIAGVDSHGAAVPGVPIADTVKRVNEAGEVLDTLDRSVLRSVQTPQGARREWLVRAYEVLGAEAFGATDEASLLERAGYPVWVVDGDPVNTKVTTADDLARGQRPSRGACEFRTGMGYDVHPFAEGRPLLLCGVRIEHARGLLGHSDADVALHALCDAVLGAASLGDIGLLFPDTAEANRGRASTDFVQAATRLAAEQGWRVVNADITVVAEEPRIGPYRDSMRQTVSAMLGVEPERVCVKATTSERLGFIGRGEGIACWSVVTLTRWACATREGDSCDKRTGLDPQSQR